MTSLFRATEAEKFLQAYKSRGNAGTIAPSRNPIKATLENGWAGRREVVVSANLAQEKPKEVDFDFLDAIIRLGYVDSLIILLDADDFLDFIPKITRLLTYSGRLRTLRLFSDLLPIAPMLPFYSRPNILDNLPPRMEALTTLHIATTRGHLYYGIIARVLIRAKNLVALKIEGARLIYVQPDAEKDRWKTYIGCRLKTLVLRWMALRIDTLTDILSKSGSSLETLHIEMVHELDGAGLGRLIGLCLPSLERLTVIIPPAEATRSGIKLEGVVDVATKAPMLSCKYLYAAGLCLSSESFMEARNARGAIRSQWPMLTALVLHDCENLSAATLTTIIRRGRLPNLLSLEAMWARVLTPDNRDIYTYPLRLQEYNDISELIHQCSSGSESGNLLRIRISTAMARYYADIIGWLHWQVQRAYEAKLVEQEKAINETLQGDLNKADQAAAAV